MAKLADASDLRSDTRKSVWVRLPPRALTIMNIKVGDIVTWSRKGKQRVGVVLQVLPNHPLRKKSCPLGSWTYNFYKDQLGIKFRHKSGRFGYAKVKAASCKVLMTLADGAKPCIRCGYCCKTSSCGLAAYDIERKQCSALQFKGKRYYCGLFFDIISMPINVWENSPAFGAGCCSPGCYTNINVGEASSGNNEHGCSGIGDAQS